MFVQALAVAAIAAAIAPSALAQSASAPAEFAEFASCEEKLGLSNTTHSLLDILGGMVLEGNNDGEPSGLAPLLQMISPETEAVLTGFDVTGADSYTLILPLNSALAGVDLNDTEVIAAADDIIMAHIVPGTLSYGKLQEETAATGMYTVESLQGFEWSFGWENQGEDAGGGFAFIVDEWNITDTGAIEISPDIRNEPDCPNLVIGIKEFVVTPDLLVIAPAPAPAATANEPTPLPGTPTTPAPADPTAPSTPEESPSGAGSYSTGSLAALSVGAAILSAALM